MTLLALTKLNHQNIRKCSHTSGLTTVISGVGEGGAGGQLPPLLDMIAPYNLMKKRFLHAVCQLQ